MGVVDDRQRESRAAPTAPGRPPARRRRAAPRSSTAGLPGRARRSGRRSPGPAARGRVAAARRAPAQGRLVQRGRPPRRRARPGCERPSAPARKALEQGLADHGVVRALVVGRHAALVAVPQRRGRPLDPGAGRALVRRAWRRSAGERHVAPGADRGDQALGRLRCRVVEHADVHGSSGRSRAFLRRLGSEIRAWPGRREPE